MERITSLLAMELRHNDEALGLVCAGCVEIHDDEEVCRSHARFWSGLRGLRARLALYETPIHIVFYKGTQA
jgi:hypothetical protein